MIPLKDLIRVAGMILEILARMKRKSPQAVVARPVARSQRAVSSSAPINPRSSQRPGLVRRFFGTLLTIIGIFAAYQVLLRLLRRYLKFPAPAFIGRVLDSDYRRRIQPPALLVARSGVQNGMKILEIGCGSGAYTPSFARAVGEEGQVFALDIQPGMLRQIQNKLLRPENQDITNLQVVEGSAYELPFEKETLDMVYMVTVFQEIPDKLRCLQEIRRVLKRRGILAVTELLPDPDYPWVTTTVNMVKAGGFRVDDVGGNLWNYTVRFRKP